MSWAVLNLFFKLFGTSMKLTLVRSAFSQQLLNILNVYIHMYIYTTAKIDLLERSMILEYKYGSPEGHLPMTDYVLHYLREVMMRTTLL